MKKKIAVLFGGNSSESEISMKSGKQVANWLDKELYEVYLILVAGNNWVWYDRQEIKVDRNDFSMVIDGKHIAFDFAYIMIHGTPGENGLMGGYFEMLGIPHSTCSTLVSSLTFSKYFCKQAMQELKIPMAKAILLRKEIPFDELKVISSVGLPCFVKPNNGGSSCGTSKVNEAKQFKEAMKIAFDEDNEVIVEEFIKGREVSCGVLKTKEKAILMPITEIVSKKEFFDYEAKYTPGMSEEITPARLSPEEVKLCHKHCSDIYDFFGCSGIVRIDFILRDDVFYFLEINTVPGMSEASIVPQQSAVYGISMKDLLTLVIRDRMPV